jgi:hypothetical protein
MIPKVKFKNIFRILNAETWINFQQNLLDLTADDEFRNILNFDVRPSFYYFGNEDGEFSATA